MFRKLSSVLIFNQVIVLMRIKDKTTESWNSVLRKHNLNHGTVIRRRITCKKIPCYMRDSACSWRIVENEKIFEVM